MKSLYRPSGCAIVGGICFLIVLVGVYKAYISFIGIREGAESYDVVIDIPQDQDIMPQTIAALLLEDHFSHLKKRKVVTRLDEYIIHEITITEEYPDYFLFTARYSVKAPDIANSNWAINHTGTIEGNWLKDEHLGFRASRLPDSRYRLTVDFVEPTLEEILQQTPVTP